MKNYKQFFKGELEYKTISKKVIYVTNQLIKYNYGKSNLDRNYEISLKGNKTKYR